MMTTEQYNQALENEAAYWDNFIAQRLLRREIPGSIDWRLAFTQFRFNHNWLPFCLGVPGINFRMPELHYVISTATARPGMRVLDLGCGAGWLSLELARLGAHVTAIDISPTNLAIGRYLADTNARNFPFLYQGLAGLPCRLEQWGSVEYQYGDLNTIALPKGEYDAVVVWDSLHHIAQLERLLEQVEHTLKPGGAFIGVDHATVTPRTEVFNRAIMPWLDDFYAWITQTDPFEIYEIVDRLARQQDWGPLAVDYDPTPVPGWTSFLDQILGELLEIIRNGLQQEALDKAQAMSALPANASIHQEESPFEDVSAERLIRALLEQFDSKQFYTICPLIMPEQHIPPYRSEPERLFQHYLSALLVNMGQRAITRNQTDGQWFLFHLQPKRSAQPQLPAISTAPTLPPEVATYIGHLEAEIARKNAAIGDLEVRLRQREAELIAARQPVLPWKRRKR